MSLYYAIFATVLVISLANGLQDKDMVVKQRIRSVLGKYLKGHVFKTTSEAVDPQHCLSDCWAENDRCQSFNYFPYLDVCELNDASNETAPQDLIDKPDVVYLTNPMFGRYPKPQMARHAMYQSPVLDPCGSNPCTHAQRCVKDAELGYRCKYCHSGYQGPKCQEHMDPCDSHPCQWGGTCISTMTSWRCVCPFPMTGSKCTAVSMNYQFDLDGSGDHPYKSFNKNEYTELMLSFWFKTAEQNTSYFLHHTRAQSSNTERLSVWRVGNTFFVELWKDYVYNFTFPLSYPVNDNNWHVVTIVLHENAELSFYLDGVMREAPKLTKAVPGANYLYHFRAGTVHIGYFKDSNDQEYFFNGSIGNVDLREIEFDYLQIYNYMVRKCTPGSTGHWWQTVWTGLFHLARPVDCLIRNPIMGISTNYFPHSSISQWLEQTVSPPRDLNAFTMIFQMRGPDSLPTNPTQIACYGDRGDDCRLSVVIHVNLTLEVIIESTRFSVDLIPIFDLHQHVVVMTWTNEGGIFELIINGILQSRVVGIEENGTISGQSRFIVGGSDFENRNLVGKLHNLNVWDKIISDDMLYMMTSQPGNDMGNVVAWRDFKKPSSIPDEQFLIRKDDEHFRVTPIGRNNFKLIFTEPGPAYVYFDRGCCSNKYAMTLTMWLKLEQFPATLFSHTESGETEPHILLRIKSDGNITFFFDDSNVSIANISVESTSGSNDFWNYLALTWTTSGDLHCNLNGVHKHISSSFQPGARYHPTGTWAIGGQGNESISGSVGQFNLWLRALPPPALMALSRGLNGLGSVGVNWVAFSKMRIGNVRLESELKMFSPEFIVQKKRDQFCNDNMHATCIGKYRARYGMKDNLGRRFGCFCEEHLSEDMNFNYGPGDYSQHNKLKNIQ